MRKGRPQRTNWPPFWSAKLDQLELIIHWIVVVAAAATRLLSFSKPDLINWRTEVSQLRALTSLVKDIDEWVARN